MKGLKKLLDTTTKKIVAGVLLLLLLLWVVMFFVATDMAVGLIKPFLWTVLLVALLWLGIHFGLKAWRKRKRSDFDEQVAAKEGIEDRKREWATWTAELEKQGIDRYELPFYLLVGEPQSGKSVLLHNSDLHFPFGQSRLSGVGGTRGCDWWFTEEAVILDLAGRLFTHEGGAADRVEFEAFLQLLYEFRPLCPANGVILVLPCDSLLADNEEESAAKATKIQNALLTLTTKLQAQLPVYLVLTKGDQVFGFAESVHRLDVERRHQMFGWSRPAEKLDSPFDLAEVLEAFEGMVRRARLLRGHMLAGARLPEALPEVDRMYAFPHELAGMQQNLEAYLKRVFTASSITDRVFFRGLYLTSGLQSGVPIAKVCTELFGQAGEADMRNLEALFQKQRAYFIKDLIRSRVFAERGLVRPTQGRVQQTQRTAVLGYGISGAIVVASILFAAIYLMRGVEAQSEVVYDTAIEEAKRGLAVASAPIPEVLYRLQLAADAAELERGSYEEAFTDSSDDFRELYCAQFDVQLVPVLERTLIDHLETRLRAGLRSHEELRTLGEALLARTEDLDLSDADTRQAVLAALPPQTSSRKTVVGGEPLSLAEAFEKRLEYGPAAGLLSPLRADVRQRLLPLARLAIAEVERSLEPGSPTQPANELGYMLAWSGAEGARDELVSRRILQSGRALELCATFSASMRALERLEQTLASDTGGRSLKVGSVLTQVLPLGVGLRAPLREFLVENRLADGVPENWPRMDELMSFVGRKFEGHEGALTASSFGLHFGSEDFGQTLFQMQESAIGQLSGKFAIPADHDPREELDDPAGLRDLCDRALPGDLTGGALVGLAAEIREIDSRVLSNTASGQVLDAFLAECLELSRRFRDQLPDAEAARAAFATTATGARIDDGGLSAPLSVPLVRELTALHLVLGELIAKRELTGDNRKQVVAWQEHVERVVDGHLRGRGSAAAWLPELPSEGTFDPRAWEVLDALAAATTIDPVNPQRYPMASVAGEALRESFMELANQLLDRWAARPPERLDQTTKTVKELASLAHEVTKRQPLREALAGVEFDAWESRVDSLLYGQLGRIADEVERIWRPELSPDRPLRTVVELAKGELAAVAEKIRTSEEEGMASLGAILDELEVGGEVTGWLALVRSGEVLANLRQWKIPSRASEVQNDLEYQELFRALERLSDLSSGDGEYLATEYADRFAAEAPRAPAVNAGVRLVRSIKESFRQRLRDEVRELYLAELRDLLEGAAFRDLFEVLFWEPGDDLTRYRDADAQDALDRLLKSRGDLARLEERFRLSGELSVADEIFPPQPPPSEDDWARVHRFLRDLRTFLLVGDPRGSSIRAAKLAFWLIPEVNATDSVWALSSLPPEERRDFFYYPGDGSSADLQREPMGPAMGRLKVADWGFDSSRSDRALTLLWSKQPVQAQARLDPLAYRYEVPGCLAPLLLAWNGLPVDEQVREEFDVTFVPERTTRSAPLRLQFERAVPLRPARP